MTYQTALTVSDVIRNISSGKYVLPAIQREFVWDVEQIHGLFDSLMRDYPIGSFLFWSVENNKIKDYQFYEFVRNYHEKNAAHNNKASIRGKDEIIAILDGQQRMTALYLGLCGTYAYRLPRKHYNNPDAYPTRKLYLNLLHKSDEHEYEYDFEFLTQEEASTNDETHHWFEVGKIVGMKELSDVNDYLIDNELLSIQPKEISKFANHSLAKLHSVVHTKPTISYYLENDSRLDKVLNIFIRINSGGTVLSYSDLLLSIATAQWKDKDAREEIISLVDTLNGIGDGFNFNKDFVLKSCLVLAGFQNIAFVVDNFNKKNMLRIEDLWETISKYLKLSVSLVASFGYNRSSLTSNYSVIPIAYYLMSISAKDSYVSSTKHTEDKVNIKRWLTLSLIKRVFGGQPDSVLRPIVKIIEEGKAGPFPLQKISKHFSGTTKTITFTNDDIDFLLNTSYGQPMTFSILSLLYPNLDVNNVFHVDHIFPKSKFTTKNLRSLNINKNDIQNYMDSVNSISNLQILEATPNIEKLDTDFDDWVKSVYPNKSLRSDYFARHYIPNTSLGLENFLQFISDRKILIRSKLESILLK